MAHNIKAKKLNYDLWSVWLILYLRIILPKYSVWVVNKFSIVLYNTTSSSILCDSWLSSVLSCAKQVVSRVSSVLYYTIQRILRVTHDRVQYFTVRVGLYCTIQVLSNKCTELRRNCTLRTVSKHNSESCFYKKTNSVKRFLSWFVFGLHIIHIWFSLNLQVEPGAMLFPAVFFEPTNKEVLQLELGRTKVWWWNAACIICDILFIYHDLVNCGNCCRSFAFYSFAIFHSIFYWN